MSKIEEGKFVRMFGRNEIRLTACAVTKDQNFYHEFLDFGSGDTYFWEPNQFWQRDPKHEQALVKFYKREVYRHSLCYNATQTVRIPMPFPSNNPDNGWGELQFLVKAPRLVRLARHRSFDTRVNQWVEEKKLIQPKTDLGNHAYLALRFYHQDHLPPVPSDWRFEPVYVSVSAMSQGRFSPLFGMAGPSWELETDFYRIDVFWEKEEIKITVTVLGKNSPEIPKHLK